MHDFITWWLETTVGPFTAADIAGFVTGALCVWLVVRQHVLNFPIGMLNNLFFLILFIDVHLFADAGLQVIYFGLAIWGWWLWTHGGTNRTELPVSRITRTEIVGCVLVFVAGYAALVPILTAAGGALPPVDAATTIASLIAQYLLNRKRIESWHVWIAVDVVYVPLYLHRGLPLTALLYLGFIGLCISGLVSWRRDLAAQTATAREPSQAGEALAPAIQSATESTTETVNATSAATPPAARHQDGERDRR